MNATPRRERLRPFEPKLWTVLREGYRWPDFRADAMAGFAEAPELFGVQVQKLAGTLALVAHDGGLRRQVREAFEPAAFEYRRHGGPRHRQARCDLRGGASASSQSLDALRAKPARAMRNPMRAARTIAQA